MQSLSNTYNKDELIKFDERVKKLINDSECDYIIEPKLMVLQFLLDTKMDILYMRQQEEME